MSLALTLLVISSSGLLVDDARLTGTAIDAQLEDALRAGTHHGSRAKAALALVIASDQATPAQTWRALRQVGKFDASVQARLDQLVPVLPVIEGSGAQARALRGSFEEALLDTGALPITADPGRRRGELKVTWTMRLADDDRVQRSWSIEAKAVLTGKDGKLVTAQSKTLAAGATAGEAAQAGMPVAAGQLVQALLKAIARDAGGVPALSQLRASPRTLEKVALLRERAVDDRRSRAVLAAFPAGVAVAVKGPGDTRVWASKIEGALVGVSQGALPLTAGPAEHTMHVRIVVEEAAGRVLAAGSLRRYTLTATAAFVYEAGGESKVLAEIKKLGGAMGSTPEEAAQAAAEKTARALYDAMVDEVSALRHRKPRA